jgi:hypothetical protein
MGTVPQLDEQFILFVLPLTRDLNWLEVAANNHPELLKVIPGHPRKADADPREPSCGKDYRG